MQINDHYEFPLQLDLDRENGKYLSPDADKSVRNLYTLHRYDYKSYLLQVYAGDGHMLYMTFFSSNKVLDIKESCFVISMKIVMI